MYVSARMMNVRECTHTTTVHMPRLTQAPATHTPATHTPASHTPASRAVHWWVVHGEVWELRAQCNQELHRTHLFVHVYRMCTA